MSGEGGFSIRKYVPILLVMLIWGSMGIPSTYAVEELSPLSVLCMRSGIAAAVLFPIVRRRYGSVRPADGEGRLLALLSLIGVVLCNYLYFFAVQHTTLTNVAVLYALGPIMTAVLAAVFLKEQVRQSRCIGIALAFFGVAELLTYGDIRTLFSAGFCVGDAAQIASSLCLAAYTVMSRKIRRTPPECVVFWLMLIGFGVTLPMTYLLEGGIRFPISGRALLSVAYLGVLCSGAGYLLQQQSIKRIGASASAAFLNGISPITILTAAVVLRETVTLTQIICMLAVFSGLILNAANRDLIHWRNASARERI